MKEQLKKPDLLGLAIIAAAVISYSVRSIWSVYQTVAVVLGGLLIVASLALKTAEIRRNLGRRSARFGINSAVSVVFLVGILAFVNYLGAQHVKRVDTTSEKIYSLSDQSTSVVQQIKRTFISRRFIQAATTLPPEIYSICSKAGTAKCLTSLSIPTNSRRLRSSTR